MRLTAGLVTLLAVLAPGVPAAAQDERSKAVDRVYRDYRDDGVIEACDHSEKALQRTLDQLTPQADIDTPDLRPALEAGIEQHQSGDCTDQAESEPTPTPTPAPAPTASPAPTSPPADDGGGAGAAPATPPSDDGGGGGGGRATPSPPSADDVTPLEPEATPVPPAATAAPPAEALIPPAPAATPAAVYSNPDDKLPLFLLVPAGLLAALALVGLLYALVSRLGWADAGLAGTRRAWREAGFRAGGTWGDFADWIRAGR